MTRFVDGPAKDIILSLNRLPKYLRVVQDRSGKWDALNNLDDKPQHGETIWVYVKCKESSGKGFIDYTDKAGRRCGSCVEIGAEYRYLEIQPSEDEKFFTLKWRSWCENQLMNDAKTRAKEAQS